MAQAGAGSGDHRLGAVGRVRTALLRSNRRSSAIGLPSGIMVTVTVRRLVEDDWSTLRSIRLAALRDAPEAFGSSIERELGFAEQHWRMRLRSSAWFVTGDDEPDGLVCGISEPGAPPQDRHVLSMWVRPESRRRGVGRQLVEAIAAWAGQDGATTVSLWVVQDNDGGRAFYRRVGFEPTGVTMALPRDPRRTEERWLRHLAG